MSRFYVPKESIRGNTAIITGREAHHIIDVMRLQRLDKVVIFDGTGKEYTGFIKDVKGNKRISVEIFQTLKPPPREKSKITLIQAIPKKDKMDYIVEKSTELGVFSIIPVLAKRTVPRWEVSKMALQASRWRKIAREASKQCGRGDIPEVSEIMAFDNIPQKAVDYDLSIIATLNDRAVPLKKAVEAFSGGKIALAIGPEGDFSQEEVGLAEGCGFKMVSLGRRVLKSDTAAVAALAILQYELSDR